jgi:phosphotriesterase-related protein
MSAPAPGLFTTLGRLAEPPDGVILPHEHLFVDLRTPDTPGHGEADPAAVVALMAPLLRRAREAGITVIVDAGPVGVGRRADILLTVSEAVGFPLVVPTGVYREPWIPAWIHEADEERLREWMLGELAAGIGDTGIRAGWIKLSAGDDGMTPCEQKVLRAASRAAAATGAAIGSHTIRGGVLLRQLDEAEKRGFDPGRFVWIHAQVENDHGLRREAARRGAWIEIDNIGQPGADDGVIALLCRCLDDGMSDRLLLSQDRGWYDPAKPGGGSPLAFDHLVLEFLPKLERAGIGRTVIDTLTRLNPWRAFAR